MNGLILALAKVSPVVTELHPEAGKKGETPRVCTIDIGVNPLVY